MYGTDQCRLWKNVRHHAPPIGIQLAEFFLNDLVIRILQLSTKLNRIITTSELLYKDTPEMRTCPLIRTPSVVPAT
jgi:hypothetical protein